MFVFDMGHDIYVAISLQLSAVSMVTPKLMADG